MALSVVAIKAAKGREKPHKLGDTDGLYLYVTPASGRYWRMNYRHLGKQKTLAFGVWPDTGLKLVLNEMLPERCWHAKKIQESG